MRAASPLAVSLLAAHVKDAAWREQRARGAERGCAAARRGLGSAGAAAHTVRAGGRAGCRRALAPAGPGLRRRASSACGRARDGLTDELGAPPGSLATWSPVLRTRRAPPRLSCTPRVAANAEAPLLQLRPRERRAPAKRRAPNTGKFGEKTADGRPKPDERTVADLVRRGWFETAEQAEAVLTKSWLAVRFPFETAGPVADWLEARLASVPDKDGRCAAARVISRFSHVLTRSVEGLQRGWDMLVLPQADGGLGFTPDRAAQQVATQPQVLCVTPERVLDTAAVLEGCGVAVGMKAIARHPTLLCLAATTLRERAAWLKQTGLDYSKILTAHPALLGISSNSSHKHLQDKLDFLRDVADLSTSDLNNAAGLLAAGLDSCLRPRYFYARLKGTARRYKLNSLVKQSGPNFVARALGRGGDEATADEMARYQKLVASPKFVAWRQRQEARLKLEAQRA